MDRLPGVGKVTEEKLKQLEVQTIADLRRMDLATLEGRLGRYGVLLYELARGIDNSEVVPDRPTQSIRYYSGGRLYPFFTGYAIRIPTNLAMALLVEKEFDPPEGIFIAPYHMAQAW